MLFKPALLAVVFSITHLAAGTDCNGSISCSNCGSNALAAIHGYMQTAINGGHGGATYATSGQHIACVGNCCAFFQNNGATGTLQQAYNAVNTIQAAGCKGCGSTAANGGLLTVNFVSNPGCAGKGYFSGGPSGDGCCGA